MSTMTRTAILLAVANMLSIALAQESDLSKRGHDSIEVYHRKRNGHACIMSIVFIVLLPLGAISIHLPIAHIPGLRDTYLVRKVPAIHAPIQILALVMMIGGMALGICIAQDLGYFVKGSSTPAHIVIGLLVCAVIILFQPLLGILQHRHFKRTGKKSALGYVHRWLGRGAILLGVVNDGLGFQLAEENDVEVPAGSYGRNFGIIGVLGAIWLGLVLYDAIIGKRGHTKVDETKVVEEQNQKEKAVATS